MNVGAWHINQRSEGINLGGAFGALMTTQNMQMQTFVAIPINEQVALRRNNPGDGTGLGVGSDGDPAYTLEAAHPHIVFAESVCLNSWDTQQKRIFAPEGTAPTLARADGGNPAGLVFAAGFSAGNSAAARTIGYAEELAPTLKGSESGTNQVPTVLCLCDQGGDRMDLYDDHAGTLRACLVPIQNQTNES